MEDDIFARISRFIYDNYLDDDVPITLDTVLGDDVYMDSLDAVDFVVFCEYEFGVSVSDYELFHVFDHPMSLSDVVSCIMSKKRLADG